MIAKTFELRDRGTAVKLAPACEADRYLLAHAHIIEHFDELESGAVIDVEFILGETPEPKRSGREEAPL